ncbi:hypothetical protein [Taibaiella chishuiensis]|uniref:Uncharacterized protein n=1 Tax=Taibaiella chishuiensis TaxID=1434707 RepID=A0A2P8CYI3_9BACT|nr:hypothetical protein [Taibaiella chishuiensis]PSK90023.1 hypothetical protein B0I18_10928 [Taibaiella chishuiensis]
MKFLRTVFILACLMGTAQAVMAQYPHIARERRGLAAQVTFTVKNSGGTASSYTYNWLAAPETRIFYITSPTTFEVSAVATGVGTMNFLVSKSSVDAVAGSYYQTAPSTGGRKLYIKNTNPSSPGTNNYTFYLDY